jgi:hypothetical protein
VSTIVEILKATEEIRPTGSERTLEPVRYVTHVGRSLRPAKPIKSAKSATVPEPDQVHSERPNPRLVTGSLEPQG